MLLVALAVLMALAQLLLPLLARHPQWLEAQLSARLQRPVTFASLEGRWQPSGPLFVMRDVAIGTGTAGGGALHLPESQLKLDFGGWLLPSRHLLNLRVHGLRLDLDRDAQGTWHVEGLAATAGGERKPVSLGSLPLELWLRDLHLRIADATSGRQYDLLADQLRLSGQGKRIRFGLSMRREGAGGRWIGAGTVRRDGRGGRVWLAGRAVDLAAALSGLPMDGYTAERGHGDIDLWVEWKHGRLLRATTRVGLADLAIQGPAGTARVPLLHGLLGVAQQGDGYALRWADASGGALVLAVHQPGAALRLDMAARDLPLAPLLPWLALKPDLAPALGAWIGSGRPRGTVECAALRWSKANGLAYLDAALRGVGIDASGPLPGLTGLGGELRGDAQAFTLQLPSQPVVLDLGHTFRKPFALTGLTGTVAAWHADGSWHVGADPLDFAGAQFAGQARGEVMLPDAGGRPFLDLYARIDHAQVPAAKLFWPIQVMPPSAVDWLDRALVAGNVDGGELVIRGSLADWPFRHNEGRFEAHASLSGLTLDYGKDWPRAEGIAAQASFVDNGMSVEANQGSSLGVKLAHAAATIADFDDLALDLQAQGNGSGASLLEFLRRSPIARAQADQLAKLKLGGSGSYAFHLSLPIRNVAALQLTGSAQLQAVDVDAPDWNVKFDKLAGPVSFDAHGAHAGPLAGGFRGEPATLDLRIAAATGQPDTVLSARLDGRYAVAELIQGYPQLDWLGAAAKGLSDYAIGFEIAHAGSGTLRQSLTLDSSLQGTALALPAPLDKPAEASLPLHLAMDLPVAGSDLQVALGPALRGRFRLPAQGRPLAATLAFGNGMPDAVPDQGLRIRGHAARLDVTGWVQHAVAGSSSDNGPGLEGVDVEADQALVFGHDFADMRIHAVPQPELLAIDVDSAGLAGHLDVPTVELRKRGITAHFQRVYWPQAASSADKPAAPAAAPAPAASASMAAPSVVAATNPAATGVDPAALPPLHVWASDLRLGEAKLGEARLETWPTEHGMHIDQLRALSKRVQINAGGDWNGNADDSHTHMRMDFAAENLGSMLGAFGYRGVFNGGKTHARLDASWPGAPSSLALADLDGTLGIEVSHGRILEVAPGVGRLFGLVSVAELPRRLTLDFGDVFGKGLAFDSIIGDFHFADGTATTDNLKIQGPSADIAITGRTGIRARDYDQQVLVVPHVGNSLPVVGAVVAGPVGAAAGFAVQGLLGKGLNRAASARYRITGSWDKPVFTLIEKHAAAPASASSVLATPAPASSAAH